MRSLPQRGFALALLLLILSSCERPEATIDWSRRDEIPPEHLTAVVEAHYRGLGAMERYEYPQAAEAFREVHKKAPGWIAGSINLAIALLNQGGEADAKAKAAGQGELGGAPLLNIDEAKRLLDEVIARQPANPHALFSRGIILSYKGDLEKAHGDFLKVVEIDPGDANAWLEVGTTLTESEGQGVRPGSKLLPKAIEAYSRALELNPGLTTAMYKLSQVKGYAGEKPEQRKLLDRFQKMDPKKNPSGSGDITGLVYGEMGHYATVIDPFPRTSEPKAGSPGPKFDPPSAIDLKLQDGDRWVTSADFIGPLAVIGRARARFGQGVAAFDADGDGKLDLYLTAAILGPKGVRDALLLNRGDGKFEEASRSAGLPEGRAGLGVAAGDFDADRRVDLYLTGVGDNRLLRNLGGKFEDVTQAAGLKEETPALSLSARWLDLDQDGDLDLYVLNYAPAAEADRCFSESPPSAGLPNSVYRNDGKAAKIGVRPADNWVPLAVATPDLAATEGLSIVFSRAFSGQEVLQAGQGAHTALAALDIDEDRDIDLVLAADGTPPTVLLNDRGGNYHSESMAELKPDGTISGLLVTEINNDGRPDLVATSSGGRVSAWVNQTTRPSGALKLAWEASPIDAMHLRSAQSVDLDLDGWADLVGLPLPKASLSLPWSRNAGTRFETQLLPLFSDAGRIALIQGFAIADFVGDALPDFVVVRDGLPPQIARNLGNGQHWLALDLAGRWKTSFDHMRTNSEGLGARLSLEGEGLHVPYDHTTPSAGLGQSVAPVVLGLGSKTSAPLLRIRWPDGVMQCELNVTADKTLELVEYSRKTGSCPVLFTWNGTRFECLGDFLGGGGLGYLVAPGVYGQPDRDESVGIAPDQLVPVDGIYRLSVVEPMDEVAYLDKLTLDVIDRPPGVASTPDERFAPEGPRPTGETFAWTRTVEPVQALDHEGRDVTGLIRSWDRRTVDQFRRLRGWIGYTEDHSLILDFGDRLASIPESQKLVLCLAGWVEYPYSQTNYAASTAGVPLRPPVLERRRSDGSWEVIDPHPGYPAGLPRMMTLDLTGKLSGPNCFLRLTTNMECYWDQAFLAVPGPEDRVRISSLSVSRAGLRDRGYLREVSPDGRLPLLYEYEYIDPAPLARMEGVLTRHGDVTPLLTTDDDQLCTVGPGDEVRLEFEAKGLPDLPEGWTRSFVLRSVGYCKDADPFTAGSDSVGPLPWKGMPDFPFAEPLSRPVDPDYAAYLRDYQTRPAGSH
ncbi:FG-GAP-like repeat-containing protein [Tundrisphaera lichenicola]|uniref:FG-GAP-like repeat-containing protein n=1 Tax=Tundrisphaera lichenicola TaxID=2029860 RepID=UPI003EB85802